MTEEFLDKHYKYLAEDYNDFLYYSPEFDRTLTSKMIEKLEFHKADTFVHLGCGTGMYLLDIIKHVELRKVIGFDLYPEMLKENPKNGKICTVASDKILIKEATHHINEKEELFNCLFKRLRKGGTLLLVHVPPELEYPLFQKALDHCKKWYANPDELSGQLKNTGFRVEHDFILYDHSIPKDKYFTMVRNRYMSVLTSMDEHEIEAGLMEMERKYQGQEALQFADRFGLFESG